MAGSFRGAGWAEIHGASCGLVARLGRGRLGALACSRTIAVRASAERMECSARTTSGGGGGVRSALAASSASRAHVRIPRTSAESSSSGPFAKSAASADGCQVSGGSSSEERAPHALHRVMQTARAVTMTFAPMRQASGCRQVAKAMAIADSERGSGGSLREVRGRREEKDAFIDADPLLVIWTAHGSAALRAAPWMRMGLRRRLGP